MSHFNSNTVVVYTVNGVHSFEFNGQISVRYSDWSNRILDRFENKDDMAEGLAKALRDHFSGVREIDHIDCHPVAVNDRGDIGDVRVSFEDGDVPVFTGLFPQYGWTVLNWWIRDIRHQVEKEEEDSQ